MPGGERRLVVVKYRPSETSEFDSLAEGMWADVYVPATLWNYPSTLTDSIPAAEFSAKYSEWVGLTPLRIYAGQADAGDRSRFTIRYECWGQSDVVDGKLNDDNSVELKPRKRPMPPGR